jgi:rod shape-determining protein MreD
MPFYLKFGLVLLAYEIDFLLAPHLKVAGVKFSALFLIVLVIAFFEGESNGALWGAVAGLLRDSLAFSYFGFSSIVLSIVGFLAGLSRRFLAHPNPLSFALFFIFPAVFSGKLISYLLLFLFGTKTSFLTLLGLAAGTAVYTSALSLLLFPWLERLEERYLGERILEI